MRDGLGVAALDIAWNVVTPTEAGFAPDLDERFEIVRQAGLLPNLHTVIAVRGGRIFLERYLAGSDAARARPLGVVRFGPDTLHDMRSARHRQVERRPAWRSRGGSDICPG